mmetsp:Transcript_4027/g.6125  ORF Transcript_4027/g.6125 Transcript_4027/m.6125 type:complete len:104 (-) Transcript_4027:1467-1778(-)
MHLFKSSNPLPNFSNYYTTRYKAVNTHTSSIHAQSAATKDESMDYKQNSNQILLVLLFIYTLFLHLLAAGLTFNDVSFSSVFAIIACNASSPTVDSSFRTALL